MSKHHNLNEAVAPGAQRVVKLDLRNYFEKSYQIERYRNKLKHFVDQSHPAILQDKIVEIQKKYTAAIDKMEEEIAGNHIAFFKSLKKNCSDIINYYNATANYWTIESNFGNDVVYGKSPTITDLRPSQKFIEKQMKTAGMDAVISNSIRAQNGYQSHLIFPFNGAKYSKVDSSVNDMRPYSLVDREKKYAVIDKLSKSPNYTEFIQRAKIHPDDVSSSWGFLETYSWLNDTHMHLTLLKQMIDEGKFPTSFMPFTDPTFYFDENYVKNNNYSSFDIKNIYDTPSYVLISGDYYAINAMYRHQIMRKLESI